MYPTAPRECFAWMAPSGKLTVGGTPSGSPAVLAGILKTIQCRLSSAFFCAVTSVSCMIMTKVTTPAGTSVHASIGEPGCASAPVYLLGMIPPSSNAVVDRISAGRGAAFGGAGGCWAKAEPARQTSKIVGISLMRVLPCAYTLAAVQSCVQVISQAPLFWLALSLCRSSLQLPQKATARHAWPRS